MTQRTIRPLTTDDIATLQAIDELAHGEAWPRRAFSDDIALADRIHRVVEVDRQIVGHGAAWADGSTCRITNVAIAAEHVGRGHAAAVLHAVVSEAIAAASMVRAELEVRPANRRAQRLYNRFGFVPVGFERGFYSRSDEHGSRDALIMAVADLACTSWRQRLDRLQDLCNPGAAA